MTNQLISNIETSRCGGIFQAEYNLGAAELFSDAALIKAIDQHPEDMLDITVQESFKTCIRNGLSSKDLLQAVKDGEFWLNLRCIDSVDGPIGDTVRRLHAELDAKLGMKTSSQIGGLLISSPTASVGYHFDLTDVRLCHLRGQKRIYIYPNEPPYLQAKNVQNVAFAAGVEKIPYDPSFEKGAQAFDLVPGNIICWEHLSPHRVDNLEGLNVSLSLEAMSMESRLRSSSHFFDGFLRIHMGKSFLPGSENRGIQAMKTAASIIIKRLKLGRVKVKPSKPAYILDKGERNFIKPVEKVTG